MKKLLVILLMLVLVLGIVGCSDDGGGVDSEVNDSGTAVESTEATDDEEVDYMESDPLPESWHGEWVVVESRISTWPEGTEVDIREYDNWVVQTTDDRSRNRWWAFDAENGLIYVYNEPPPFDIRWFRDTFDLRHDGGDELVFVRHGTSVELRMERVN